MRTGGRTDGHDEANSCLSKFFERAEKQRGTDMRVNIVIKMRLRTGLQAIPERWCI